MQLRAAAIAIVLAAAATARADAPPPSSPPAPAPAPSTDDGSSDDATWNDVSAGIAPPSSIEPHESPTDGDPPTTGAAQAGMYGDSDSTTVYRVLGTLSSVFGGWTLDGRASIDAVTSASIDVRTSPQLGKVDVVTGASGRSTTSGGMMSDTRYEATGGAGWTDGSGHAVNLTSSVASERDYTSVAGGVNGSIDVLERTTTLLGGATVTDNWISSVLDPTLHGKMLAVAWSAGVARVLTPDDAVRVRYDGRDANGDQASPYRFVRFGDWSTIAGTGGQILFTNTIGSVDGLPEKVPEHRLAHALTFEWLHALADHVALHPSVRLAHDSWGVDDVTAAIDLRVAEDAWRLDLGYRYYRQRGASFFHDKYLMDPSAYSYWTSDKELGDQVGHMGTFGVAFVVDGADAASARKVLLDAHVDVFRYRYPGFVLLPERTSVFVALGLSWEL